MLRTTPISRIRMYVTIFVYSAFVLFVVKYVVPAEASDWTAYVLGILFGLYMSTKEPS